jgi:hypothetical protein
LISPIFSLAILLYSQFLRVRDPLFQKSVGSNQSILFIPIKDATGDVIPNQGIKENNSPE